MKLMIEIQKYLKLFYYLLVEIKITKIFSIKQMNNL